MNKIEILKAKVDFHKTFVVFSSAALLAGIAGSYSSPFNIDMDLFFIGSFLFLILLAISIGNYTIRHKELIDELRK